MAAEHTPHLDAQLLREDVHGPRPEDCQPNSLPAGLAYSVFDDAGGAYEDVGVVGEHLVGRRVQVCAAHRLNRTSE